MGDDTIGRVCGWCGKPVTGVHLHNNKITTTEGGGVLMNGVLLKTLDSVSTGSLLEAEAEKDEQDER